MKVHVLMDIETKKPLGAAKRRETATHFAAKMNRPISVEEVEMLDALPVADEAPGTGS